MKLARKGAAKIKKRNKRSSEQKGIKSSQELGNTSDEKKDSGL